MQHVTTGHQVGSTNDRERKGVRRLRRGTAIAAGVVALGAGLWVPAAHAATTHAAVTKALGARGHTPATTTSNLIDHGGKVLPTSDTYAIWWGTQKAWPNDVQTQMGTFFGGLNGTSFLNTGTQYMRTAPVGSAYSGSKIDTSAPPRKVSASTLGKEVAKEYGTSLDPAGIYFVYTSNFPKGGNFCAWHSFTSVNGQNIAVAYMPNTSGVAGCDPGNLYNLSGSEGLRSLANVTSHEFMEAITDTLPGTGTYGWIDSSGSEIGDKCAWQFKAPVTLSNGSTWQLQEEWSNAVIGCVQTTT